MFYKIKNVQVPQSSKKKVKTMPKKKHYKIPWCIQLHLLWRLLWCFFFNLARRIIYLIIRFKIQIKNNLICQKASVGPSHLQLLCNSTFCWHSQKRTKNVEKLLVAHSPILQGSGETSESLFEFLASYSSNPCKFKWHGPCQLCVMTFMFILNQTILSQKPF